MASRSATHLLETFGDAVWRADALATAASAEGAALPSGHAALDQHLPGGGWPVGALCDILQPPGQHHEWRLLLPALRTLTQTVVLVAPPHAPFGPGLAAQGLALQHLLWVKAEALAQRLWAAEQALRCAGVAALLVWLPQVRSDHLRRLHLAAQAHGKLLFALRPASAQHESSPAVLRLLVSTGAGEGAAPRQPERCVSTAPAAGLDDSLTLHILKRRGPPLASPFTLNARPAALSALLAVSAPQPASVASDQTGKALADDRLPSSGTNMLVFQTMELSHALDRLAAAA